MIENPILREWIIDPALDSYLLKEDSKPREGIFINDIVKEYPDMIKIIIWHDGYRLPANSEIKKLKKISRREDSHHRSLRRSKTAVMDIMLSNRFDLWCTFTYNCRNCYPKCNNKPCTCSPSVCKRYDANYTYKVLRNWFRNQKKHSPNLRYLAVPEKHKNGAIHFHCMMSGFNGRLKPTKKRTKNNQIIFNATGYYSGFTEFVKIGDISSGPSFDEQYKKVAHYLCKYITKDMPDLNGRKRRYLVSEGLTRPRTTVNGVATFGLERLIRHNKPDYITDFLEVQKIPYTGVLSTDKNSILF